MAFGEDHKVTDPTSAYGEIWYTHVTHSQQHYFGILFVSENLITDNVKTTQLGLKLDEDTDYVLFSMSSKLADSAVINYEAEPALPIQDRHEFDLLYLSPLWGDLASGERIAFVGDMTKYVPFSRARFSSVDYDTENGAVLITSVGHVEEITFAIEDENGDIQELIAT